MKANEVVIGEVYGLKVGNRVTEVEIRTPLPGGGWLGISRKSGKEIRIKSAERLITAIAWAGETEEEVVKVEAEPVAGEEDHAGEAILKAISGSDGGKMHFDKIVEAVNLPVPKVSSELMILEIKRQVRQHPGKVFEALAVTNSVAVTQDKNEPRAFCCGCGQKMENRAKWYCGDECKKLAKKTGVRYCWKCGKPIEKGMTCESC